MSKHKQQNKLQSPTLERARVEDCERSVDTVTFVAFEMVSAHLVVILETADHRLAGGQAAHLSSDSFGDAADLTVDPDLEAVRIGMVAIAFVGCGSPLHL